MKKETLPLSQIVDLSNAVDLVGDSALLGGTVTYRLGRLGDFVSGPVKKARKAQEKLLTEIREKQDPLLEKLNKLEDKNSPEAVLLTKEIQALNLQFAESVEKIMEEKEEISIPELKLDMFIAEEDTVKTETITEKDVEGKDIPKKIQIKIKKGQSLVPVRFFKLMGNFIVE